MIRPTGMGLHGDRSLRTPRGRNREEGGLGFLPRRWEARDEQWEGGGEGVGTSMSKGKAAGVQVREKAQAGVAGSQSSKGSQGRNVRALHPPRGVCALSVGWRKPTLTSIRPPQPPGPAQGHILPPEA